VRGLAQHLRPLLAGVNSFAQGQAFAQYAVPAVAVPKAGMFGGSKRILTPLSEPLANVNIPNPTAPKAPELQVRCRQHRKHRKHRNSKCRNDDINEHCSNNASA
jgi:hypothetical protein